MSDRIFSVRPTALMLRELPSTQSAVITRLKRGQLVARLDPYPRGPWWRVFADTPGPGAFVGYVHSEHLDHWSMVIAQPPSVEESAPPRAERPAPPPPAPPASEGLDPGDAALLAPLKVDHGFAHSVKWRLAEDGVRIENAPPETTGGRPQTVERVWRTYGPSFVRWCKAYDVPVELAIATACTETSGDHTKTREEPGYVSDEQTPHKVSPGLMQTLISTARGALAGEVPAEQIDRAWLLSADNSIRAGVKYIAQQGRKTQFDPPKVACAYNAGDVYENQSPDNRWKMRQYPIGSGEHADRFVRWFNDCFRYFATLDRSEDLGPSFFRKMKKLAAEGSARSEDLVS